MVQPAAAKVGDDDLLQHVQARHKVRCGCGLVASGVVHNLARAEWIILRISRVDGSFERDSSVGIDDDSGPGVEVVDALADFHRVVVEPSWGDDGVARCTALLDQILDGSSDERTNEGLDRGVVVRRLSIEIDDPDVQLVDVVDLLEKRAPEETQEAHDSHREDEVGAQPELEHVQAHSTHGMIKEAHGRKLILLPRTPGPHSERRGPIRRAIAGNDHANVARGRFFDLVFRSVGGVVGVALVVV